MSQVISEQHGSIPAPAIARIASSKILFADQLRAVAFLSVVFIHWVGIYSLDKNFISMVTGAPVSILGNPSYYINALPPLPHFNFGPFGVAIFFLISGFVIPFSLDNKSPFSFLLSRAVRIYPTYIACSLVTIGFYFSSHAYWGVSGSISFWQYMSNISMTSSVFNFGSIDFVNWTLSIEIKFYLVCSLFYQSLKSGKSLPVVFLSIATFALTWATKDFTSSSEQGHFSFNALKGELMYIEFMTLGILFNFLYTKKIDFIEFFLGSLIISVSYFLTWKFGVQPDQFPATIHSYLYGYIVFLTCYMCRGLFKPLLPLKFLSNISYSFYAIHSIAGYCTMRYLEHKGMSFEFSIISAIIFVGVISTIINRTVEDFSIKISKKV